MARPSRTQAEWEHITTRALKRLLVERSAIVRPEAEAILGESDWVHRTFGYAKNTQPQPHHLTTAHHNLLATGELIHQTSTRSTHQVTTWLDAEGLRTRGSKTRIERAASAKRTLYRTWLAWSTKKHLCADVAEQLVHNAIEGLNGDNLRHPTYKPGHLTQLQHRTFDVGPLDAGGYWPYHAADPEGPAFPFAVEVKNMRRWFYPWTPELWHFLAKTCPHTDVTPVFVARRIHLMTFRFFEAIGVIGHQTRKQWFTNPSGSENPRHRLTEEKFTATARALSFTDATYQSDTTKPPPQLVRLFRDRPYVRLSADDTLSSRSRRRWNRAALIIQQFTDLSQEPHDTALWDTFARAMSAAGLATAGWASFDG